MRLHLTLPLVVLGFYYKSLDFNELDPLQKLLSMLTEEDANLAEPAGNTSKLSDYIDLPPSKAEIFC